MNARRIELVDALRACALFGILQVNIQSFAWGPGDALGYFLHTPSTADVAAYALAATFVTTKFIALFAFLFGLGFALQQRSLRRRLGEEAARGAARRRFAFLLAIGVAHGTLLYYGDILTAYALCGFVLLAYARVRPARLARAARNWMIGYLVLVAALYAATAGTTLDADGRTGVPQEMLQRLATYTTASWLDQLPLRAGDYASLLANTLLGAGPFVVALFLLGALAGRQGWLARPQRHPRVRRAAVRFGMLGLVVSATAAWINTGVALEQPDDPSPLGTVLMFLGFPLMALYVAAIVRWRDAPPVRAAIAWLAPAGRMPLTNYLLQSVAMGALLSGWGLGLGASLGHAALAGIALAIAAVQVLVSRAWIASGRAGPVETLWRRVSTGG